MKEALDVILKAAPESKYLLKVAAFIDPWTVATDGHRLLAIRGIYADPPGEKYPKIPLEWFADEGQGVAVSADALLSFVGPMPPPCNYCDGSGKFWSTCDHCDDGDHECVCRECGGGKKDRPMQFGPAVVNANLYSDVFAALKPSGELRIFAPKWDDRVMIFGDGWILLAMPMRTEKGKECPKFGPMAEVKDNPK